MKIAAECKRETLLCNQNVSVINCVKSSVTVVLTTIHCEFLF